MAVLDGVYFVEMISGKERFVKIGYSSNIKRRMKALRTASPFKVVLLALWSNATMAQEKLLHEAMDEYRHSGEWFYHLPSYILIARLNTYLDDFKIYNDLIADFTPKSIKANFVIWWNLTPLIEVISGKSMLTYLPENQLSSIDYLLEYESEQYKPDWDLGFIGYKGEDVDTIIEKYELQDYVNDTTSSIYYFDFSKLEQAFYKAFYSWCMYRNNNQRPQNPTPLLLKCYWEIAS